MHLTRCYTPGAFTVEISIRIHPPSRQHGGHGWSRRRAQQGERIRRVGVLMGVTDDADGQARVKALQQGLHELGWIEAATCASIVAGRAVMQLAFAIYEYAPLSGVAEVDRVLG